MFCLYLIPWLAWAFFGFWIVTRLEWPTSATLIYALGLIAGGFLVASEVTP